MPSTPWWIECSHQPPPPLLFLLPPPPPPPRLAFFALPADTHCFYSALYTRWVHPFLDPWPRCNRNEASSFSSSLRLRNEFFERRKKRVDRVYIHRASFASSFASSFREVQRLGGMEYKLARNSRKQVVSRAESWPPITSRSLSLSLSLSSRRQAPSASLSPSKGERPCLLLFFNIAVYFIFLKSYLILVDWFIFTMIHACRHYQRGSLFSPLPHLPPLRRERERDQPSYLGEWSGSANRK